jgi:hypothetical protein
MPSRRSAGSRRCGLFQQPASFAAERAEDSRRAFVDYCTKPQLEAAQKQLEQVVVSEPKPELSKFAALQS